MGVDKMIGIDKILAVTKYVRQQNAEVVCTVRLAIGFKQMVCTVTTCYWFLALLWFYPPFPVR